MLALLKSDLSNELLKCLEKIEYGSIQITLPSGKIKTFNAPKDGPNVSIKINTDDFFSSLFDKGDIGLGESYLENQWESANISDLIHFCIKNKTALEQAIYGRSPSLLLYKLKHFFKKNSKLGSKKNISYHYDIGNSFYKLWLDSTMTYSSALWGTDQNLNLSDAQQKKYNTVLQQLKAKPGDHILEIGCGWGGFAEFAATRGFRVTGLTLSSEQLNFAAQRIKNHNLEEFVSFHLQDYRDHEGKYDHVVSIEMLEAVGKSYWDIYFKRIKSFLKINGSIAIQSIVIDEKSFENYSKSTDFIQQYIFPGGMLPTLEIIKNKISLNGGSEISYLKFGSDYARTLNEWDQAFVQNLQQAKDQGYTEKFLRMWHFYFNYCEGGFKSGQIDVAIISSVFSN